MNRRGFLSLLGAATAVTAAGLVVPDVARRFFLPPKGGWSGAEKTHITIDMWAGDSGILCVGDVISFSYPPLPGHKLKQFIVTSVNNSAGSVRLTDRRFS